MLIFIVISVLMLSALLYVVHNSLNRPISPASGLARLIPLSAAAREVVDSRIGPESFGDGLTHRLALSDIYVLWRNSRIVVRTADFYRTQGVAQVDANELAGLHAELVQTHARFQRVAIWAFLESLSKTSIEGLERYYCIQAVSVYSHQIVILGDISSIVDNDSRERWGDHL